MDSPRPAQSAAHDPSPPAHPSGVRHAADSLRARYRQNEHDADEERWRAGLLRFVREMARRSASCVTLEELLRFCALQACDLLQAIDCALSVRATATLPLHAVTARPDAASPSAFLHDSPLTEALDRHEEIHLDAASAAPYEDHAIRQWHTGPILGLPLFVDETVIGALHVAWPENAHPPDHLERARAREVAAEIAVAVKGALRLFETQMKTREVERSREEVRGYFQQIGTAMSAALNLDQLLRLIVNLCIRATQADGGSVYLIEGGRMRQRVAVGPQTGAPVPHLRESLLGWGDRDGLTSRVARTEPEGSPTALPVRAFLGIPLTVKAEIRGQINLYRHRLSDFPPDEVALLTTFAGQAALAIENAQAFRLESQRAREATLLYRGARSIAGAATLSDVLRASATQMMRVTEADRCLIYLRVESAAERHRGEFRLAHSVGLSADQSEFFRVLEMRPTQFSSALWDALRRGKEAFLASAPHDSPALTQLFELLPGNACLLVPLLADEEMLGLVYLDDSNVARTYDASQLRLTMTLAIQAATAMQRTQLVERQSENFEQLKALHEVSTAVTGTLSLPRVLKMVVEKAGELLGNHSCALMVQTGEEGPLELRESTNLPPHLQDAALQERIASECLRRKRPVIYHLHDTSERRRPRPNAVEITAALRSNGLGGCLVVPLMARRKMVGVLNCFAHAGHRFDAAAVRLMRSFANQAAGALENAHLHEVVKDKLAQLGTLFEVGKAITSTLQLDRVLQTVTEQVLAVMGADGCAILLLDEQASTLRMRASSGLGPQHARRSFSLGSGFLGLAAQTGRPMMLVDDATIPPSSGDELFGSGSFPETVRRDGMRSILAVPLTVRGRLIGLINIYERRVHYHDPAEISLLTTLSSQAAIAIENARLYHEKNEVAQLLRSILLPREKFHHARVEVGHRFISSQELAGDYYEMFPISAHRAAFCIADVSGKGPKAAVYAARARYIVKSYAQAGYSPAEVVSMLNRLICPETEPEMFITLFYGEIDLERGELEYTSAGHEPAIVWSARRQKVRLLESRDLVIGVDAGRAYKHSRSRLDPGDLLVLYTDGVTEARREGVDEAFGLKRLRALVSEHANLAPQALADRITTTVQRFAHRKLHDDFSLMVVRV